MDKSPDAFRTISEVAEWLDTPAHVLRFWESRFSQIKPVKRAGGRRYYRPTDMLLLGGIKKLLHEDGTTIKAVQNLLREQGVKHVQSLSQPVSVQVTVKKKAPEAVANADDAQQPAPVMAKETIDPMAERISLSTNQPAVKPKEPPPQVAASSEEPLYDTLDEIDIDNPVAASNTKASDQVIKLPEALKPAAEIPRQDIQDIEALYYSLKMVRNNMKRTCTA